MTEHTTTPGSGRAASREDAEAARYAALAAAESDEDRAVRQALARRRGRLDTGA